MARFSIPLRVNAILLRCIIQQWIHYQYTGITERTKGEMITTIPLRVSGGPESLSVSISPYCLPIFLSCLLG